MFLKVNHLNEYFNHIKKEDEIFMYRISDIDKNTEDFILKFFDLAKKNGTIIKERLPNPKDLEVQYYNQIIGEEFKLNQAFFIINFQKWIPNLSLDYCKSVALEMYIVMAEMRKNGKTDGIIKSVYIKYMCWLHYCFSNAVISITKNKKACIIFEGNSNLHELNILNFLAKIGCDVIIIDDGDDEKYKKNDANFEKSLKFMVQNPTGKCILSEIVQKSQRTAVIDKISGSTNFEIITNAKNDDPFDMILQSNRENTKLVCSNYYYKILGVDDVVYYKSKIHTFFEKIRNQNRQILSIENGISPPMPNEMSDIKIANTTSNLEILKSLVLNILYPENNFIETIIKQQFVSFFAKDIDASPSNIFKNQALTIIVWLNRYKNQLFKNYKNENTPVLIALNGASNKNQKMFFEFISKLPVDVLLLCPNLQKEELSTNAKLLTFPHSLEIDELQLNQQGVTLSTVAFNASQELDDILYSDGLMFRDFQSKKAQSITLQTTFDEIKILWNQPAQFRPNFEKHDDKVVLPVICAKVNGTLNLTNSKYWNEVQNYITKDTYILKRVDFVSKEEYREAQIYATEFFKNGKLAKNKIKEHKCYKYDYLRTEIQDHILDKLEMLINSKIIKGTLELGMEYTIISVILSLNIQIERLLQKYDFNKDMPKVVLADCDNTRSSNEDAIVLAFLNFAGFDIIMFTPTGNQKLEKSFNQPFFQQYSIGELTFDLIPPNLKYIDSSKFNFFRRNK